jgi:hypothetical protein
VARHTRCSARREKARIHNVEVVQILGSTVHIQDRCEILQVDAVRLPLRSGRREPPLCTCHPTFILFLVLDGIIEEAIRSASWTE